MLINILFFEKGIQRLQKKDHFFQLLRYEGGTSVIPFDSCGGHNSNPGFSKGEAFGYNVQSVLVRKANSLTSFGIPFNESFENKK
jgi:hypothetical protein